MRKVHKVFGPPGTGKTTFLLNQVENELALNTLPSKIGFFSFTNKAADEAKFRAVTKFPQLVPEDFRSFRTLHSLALETIGGSANFTTMATEDWNTLGAALGLSFSCKVRTSWDETMSWDGVTLGDKVRALCDLARLRGCSLLEGWRKSDIEGVTLPEIERFAKALRIYKTEKGMIDFCDMLELACASNNLPSYKLLIVDEAQDLSSLQWDLVKKLVERAETTFIAGDDDQAIFQWAGADVERFIGFEGSPLVLDQSYRVPVKVSEFAEKLTKNIKPRVAKLWKPREETGTITKHHVFDSKQIGMAQGEWLILVRNNYQLKAVVEQCVELGYWFSCKMGGIREKVVPAVTAWENLRKGEAVSLSQAQLCFSLMSSGLAYGSKAALERADDSFPLNMADLRDYYGLQTDAVWHEALNKLTSIEISYLRSCRRHGEKLLKEPRIKISTIHGAKGGEADNVVLFSDYSRATDANATRFPADEHRVWYVAVTRARQNLHVILPQTNTYFRPICN